MSSDDFDFGFSFHDEDDVEAKVNDAASAVEQSYKEKLDKLEELIVPFLKNLTKDPDKVMIRWPNRKEIVEKQLKKIQAILKDK